MEINFITAIEDVPRTNIPLREYTICIKWYNGVQLGGNITKNYRSRGELVQTVGEYYYGWWDQ